MSMIRQLVAEITNAKRLIDDQIAKLRSYQSELDSVQQHVDAVFSGSSVQYGRDMMDRLSQTKQKVSEAIDNLQLAKSGLEQISMF